MKKRTKIIGISIATIAVIAVASMCMGGNKKKQDVAFATTVVKKGTVSESITATGTIKPVTEVEVGTQVSGIVDKLYVDYNSVVKKGQLIAEMDRITLNSELQSAQANYNSAKAEYEYQKKNFERNQKLHEKQLISDIDYEQSAYNFQTAKSQMDNSAASLAKSRRNLSYATITSPIDGVVISREVEEGQTVAAGFETPTLFTIAADLTQMEVIADVDEADIGGVENGQRATFTVDAYPEDVFTGTVTEIRLGSTSSSTTTTSTSTVVTYEVVISAPNPELKLKPRLTANVTIYKNERNNVLTVPSRALRFNPTPELVGKNTVIKDVKAEKKVWTKEGDTFTAHEVKTGVQGSSEIEIVSGLKEGDVIVVEAKIAGNEESDSAAQRRGMFGGPGPRGPM